MKTSIIATALLAAGVCVLAPVSGAQTLKKIGDTNRITVSYREAAVPFSYLAEANKPVGFAMDLSLAVVDDVRNALGKPVETTFIPVNAQNRMPLLTSGAYDLECGSTTNTSARWKDVAFSTSYFYTGTRLLTRKGSGIRDYGDLVGKSVTTTGGSSNEKVLRKHFADNNYDIKFVLAEDYADAFKMVETGGADAFAMDDILLFGLVANSANPAGFEVVGTTLQVEPYGCMVRKDDPEFKKVVDTTIARLMKSGEFARLYSKWFEAPIPPKNISLNMPMSTQLKANLVAFSDKPAQ